MTTIEVPRTVFAALRALLSQIGRDTDGDVLDLRGLGLRAREGAPAPGADLSVATLLSSRTKEGRVELQLNGEVTQMDLDKAREVVGMLQQAIEAAMSDQMLFAFLTGRVGLAPEAAAAALLDFRELRQGSREVVNPS